LTAKKSLAIILVLAITLCPLTVDATQSQGTAFVIVELDGFSVSNLLPHDYVLTNSPVLDSTIQVSSNNILHSIDCFISRNHELLGSVTHIYSVLIRGFSCDVRRDKISKIKQIPGVKSVYELPEYELYLDDSIGSIDANKAWGMTDKKGRAITGNGTVIGVIDSGLDYNHEDLGSGVGEDKKVMGGFDFADELDFGKDGRNHGTHVAGICAANGKVKGVAPDANLVGFKVFSSEGRRTDVGGNIVKSLEKALLLKCDVVNMSLGSVNVDPGTEIDSIYHNAIDAGITICCAAGNNGARAPGKGFPIGYPSSIEPIISVAASDDSVKTVLNIIKPEDAKAEIIIKPLQNSPSWVDGDYAILDCGYGNTQQDFEGKDFKGKIALIKRGPEGVESAYFRYKSILAGRAGAIACIIYNHSFGDFNGTLVVPEDIEQLGYDTELIPSAVISKTEGEKLLSFIHKAQCKVSISTKIIDGMMTYYSSSGPSPIKTFKPDISAPGESILSTTVTVGNNHESTWGRDSGTSMACPHASGAVALLSQAHPDESPSTFKSRLMSTAQLLWNNTAKEYVPLTIQGSGRIDIDDAISTKAVFDPPSAYVVTDTSGLATLNFNIINLSNEELDVDISYYSIGSDTDGNYPEKNYSIESLGSKECTLNLKVDIEIQGILEGLIFAEIGDKTIHLPIMIENQTSYLPPQLSYLRVTDDPLNMEDEHTESMLTFKLSYGSFITSPENQNDFITSNYSGLKLTSVTEDSKEIGEILHEDNYQIGYYHIPWDGIDKKNRLAVHNGRNYVQGQGIRTIYYNSDKPPSRIEQKPPATAHYKVTGSPLLDEPYIDMITVPSKPGYRDEFDLRISTSRIKDLSALKFSITYPAEYIELLGVRKSSPFGLLGEITFENNKKRAEASVEIHSIYGFSDWHMGTAVSIICKAVKPSKHILPLGFVSPVATVCNHEVSLPSSYAVIRGISENSCFDLNTDGIVNTNDFSILSGCMGSFSGEKRYRKQMDFDLDGRIDVRDMLMLARNIVTGSIVAEVTNLYYIGY
jgi:minor extracellular serine protease Vpr